MIHSTPPPNRPSVPVTGDATSRAPRVRSTEGSDADKLASGASAHIKAALAKHPEIRSEVVERARMIVNDPDYPPREIIDSIARSLLTAAEGESI